MLIHGHHKRKFYLKNPTKHQIILALKEANNMEVTLSGLDQQQTQNKSFKTLYTTMIFRESTCMFTPKFTNTFVHCNTQREKKK